MADVSSPIAVLTDGIFTQATAGLESGYGLRADGALFSWGDNTYGQLGDDTYLQRNTPVSVVGGHKFNYIAAGWHHILGIKEDGSLWSWGSNEFGQTGVDEEISGKFKVSNWQNVGTQAIFTPIGEPYADTLTINVPPTNQGATYIPVLAHDGRGTTLGAGVDFDISVDFELIQHPSTNAWIISMDIEEYNTDVFMTAQRLYLSGDGYRGVYTKQNGGAVNFGAMTFQNDQFGTLRITRVGSLWTFYAWWANAWHTIQTFTSLEPAQAVEVRLEMRTVGSVPTAEGQFRNFSETAEQTTIYPLPTSGEHEFVKIDAGECHSIGLKADGTIWTWGCNDGGQLGGYDLSIGGIGAGGVGFGGVIDRNTGYLWMWGNNFYGNLGDGTKTTKSSPVTVKGPQGWGFYEPARSLGLDPCGVIGNCTGTGPYGDSTGWATKTDGSLWMWGNGKYGQLGNGSFNVSKSSPVSVLGSDNIKFLTANGSISSTYALGSNGELYVWGETYYILRGASTVPLSVNSPIAVEPVVFNEYGPTNDFVGGIWRWLSTSQTGGLVGTGSRVMGWGEGGANGRLCLGNALDPVSYPVTIPGFWTQAAHGQNNTIWLDLNNNVWMCGYNDPLSGMSPPWFGGGGPTNRSTHTIVVGSPHSAILVREANQRQYHGFLREDGSLWMWGYNQYGALGVGDFVSRTSPTSVLGSGQSYSFVDFRLTGQYGTVALDSEGQVWGWGQWENIGDNTTTDKNTPTKTSLGLITPEQFRAFPTQVPITTLFDDIAAGDNHNLALDSNNQLWAWGDNTSGQLGLGDTTSRTSPTAITSLSADMVDLAAGTQFSYALDENDDLWAWGDNTCGKLGDAVFPNWTAVGAGAQGYGFAIDGNTGKLWSWGFNISGQLGDNSTTNRSSPVSVVDPDPTTEWGVHPDAYELGTGPCDIPGGCGGTGHLSDNTAWAVKKDGSAWMWGNNAYGCLGIGTFSSLQRSTPRSVLGFGGVGKPGIIYITSTPGGPASTYALDTRGRLWVWGYTGYILAGTGSPSSVNSPVDVREAILNARGVTDPFVPALFRWMSAGIFGGFAGDGSGLWVWGDNTNCKLCKGDCTGTGSPISLTGQEWAYGAHGSNNSYLIDQRGDVHGCGYNTQISAMVGPYFGGGGPTNRSTPTILLGTPHNAIIVRTPNSDYGGGFLRADGSLWMWGENNNGQLGVGHTTSVTSPTSVLGSGQSYSFVDFMMGGESGTVALDTEGQVWGWGQWGHVGDNTTTDRSTPTMTATPAPPAPPAFTTTPVQVYKPW